MSLKLVTINVNGLRENRKRELVFNWLYQRNMIVFVYRRRTVQELILTGGKVNGKHKGAVLVHGYVDLANQRAWLSF